MNNIQNANILITNIEAKMASTGNMKYTITDNEKRKFTFFQNKKDGTPGEVYTSFNSMGLKVGDTAYIGFFEEEDSFTNQKGELIKYTKRTLASIMEAHATPSSPLPRPQTLPIPQTTASERNWEREAYEKCCSLWSQMYKLPSEAQFAVDNGEFYKLFQAIKKSGEKYYNNPLREAVKSKAPQVVEPVEEEPWSTEPPVELGFDPNEIPF